VKLVLDIQEVKQVKESGSVMTENGQCDTDIRRRIAMAMAGFTDKQPLLTRKSQLELKKRLVKVLVFSVALYGAET